MLRLARAIARAVSRRGRPRRRRAAARAAARRSRSSFARTVCASAAIPCTVRRPASSSTSARTARASAASSRRQARAERVLVHGRVLALRRARRRRGRHLARREPHRARRGARELRAERGGSASRAPAGTRRCATTRSASSRGWPRPAAASSWSCSIRPRSRTRRTTCPARSHAYARLAELGARLLAPARRARGRVVLARGSTPTRSPKPSGRAPRARAARWSRTSARAHALDHPIALPRGRLSEVSLSAGSRVVDQEEAT